MTSPADQVEEETTYLAFHLHWPLADILDLEHADRRRYVAAVAGLLARSPHGV